MKYAMPKIINDYPTEEWISNNIDKRILKKSAMRNIVFKNAVKIYYRTRACEELNWRCCWCSVLMTEERNYINSATLEHIIPKSKGGLDEFFNYSAACSRCNTARGTYSIEEFLETIKKYREKHPKNKKMRGRFTKKIGGNFGDNLTQFDRHLAQLAFMRHPNHNPFDEGSVAWLRFEKYKDSVFKNVIGDRHAAKKLSQELDLALNNQQ